MEGWIRRSLLHPEIQPAAWALIAAAVIVAVCFSNSLPNGFILDDYQIVEVNPAIRTIAPIHFLTTPYWGEKSNSGIYRPLTIFSFSLEYPLWHRSAGGYRLTNLLLHAINGFLIFLLARNLLQSVPAGWAASAIYLAHPAHTEPVVGLAGRSELLAAMFFLLAWILFRKAAERRQNVAPGASPGFSATVRMSSVGAKDFWEFFRHYVASFQNDTSPRADARGYILPPLRGSIGIPRREILVALSVAAFFLSLLSKENAIVFPAVIVLDRLMFGGTLKNVLLEWKRFAAITMAAVAYLALRMWVLGGVGIPRNAQYLDGQWTFAQRELTSGRAFLKYFQLLLAPVDVTGDYDFNSIPLANSNDWLAWAGLLLVAATILFAIRLLKTQPTVGFAILFFYVTILPVSNWIMPTALIMSERSLYLPSLGICLIAGLAWANLSDMRVRRLAGLGVMSLAAILCVAHNYIWRDNLTFFGNVVRVFPDNVRGRQGYGTALVEAGRPQDAIEQFDAGLRIKRNTPLLVSLGEGLMQLDRNCTRARPVLNEALGIQPSDHLARWLLASCFEREGALQQAEATYRQAVSDAQFPDPKLLSDWGRLLEKTGRLAEAQEAYRRAALLK